MIVASTIQAVYDGKRWRVIEILWQAETPAEPSTEVFAMNTATGTSFPLNAIHAAARRALPASR